MDLHKESAMLILTRMEGEKIVIGDDITIVVTGLNDRQVKLGIDAPREIRVMREELLEREPSAT
jgi:carbon storage regulator